MEKRLTAMQAARQVQFFDEWCTLLNVPKSRAMHRVFVGCKRRIHSETITNNLKSVRG